MMDLIREAMDIKFPARTSSEDLRREAKPGVVRELSAVVLVEVEVTGADAEYSAGDFGQPGSEQAAYMESYLSPDGTTVISEYDRPPGDSLRVDFFLHFYDPARPLNTSYGVVSAPRAVAMPERLRKILRYEPVD
jgi:hypothetical protein